MKDDKMPWATSSGRLILTRAFGREWRLSRHANLEELWEGMEEENYADDLIPYWTELWPSSLLLSNFLYSRKEEISGGLCLDLGCGLGFTAMIGQWLGCRVVAVDYIFQALVYCRVNALANKVEPPLILNMDWLSPAFKPRQFDRIWGADIIYERRFFEPVLDFLAYALKPDGVIWIAEPGRTIFASFLEIAAKNGWSVEKAAAEKVDAVYAQAEKIDVSIWQFWQKKV